MLLKLIDNSHRGHGSGLDVDRVDSRTLLAGLNGVAVDLLRRESELFVGAELSSTDTFQRGDSESGRQRFCKSSTQKHADQVALIVGAAFEIIDGIRRFGERFSGVTKLLFDLRS